MFNAFKVFSEDGKISGRVVEQSLDDLSEGAVVIKAAFSSVNYKDALAATGAGKIMRRFPLIGGIDVAGTVESSADARFKAGDPVVVTGYDLGVAHDGGYAGYVRVPADWVVPMPHGLTLFDTMAIGTAGFTAALSIVEMERNGLDALERPRDRDRRDRRRRQHRDSVVGGARLLGDGADREGAGSPTTCARSARPTSSRATRSRWARGRSRSRCGPAPSIPSAATSSPG